MMRQAAARAGLLWALFALFASPDPAAAASSDGDAKNRSAVKAPKPAPRPFIAPKSSAAARLQAAAAARSEAVTALTDLSETASRIIDSFVPAIPDRYDVVWLDREESRGSVRYILRVAPLSDAFIESYLDAEWPAVAGIKVKNPALEAMGTFKVDALPIAQAGANQTQVQQMLDRVGFK